MIQHLIQCFIPPLHCLLIVIVTIDDAVVGIVAVWRIDNAGEESTFRQVQILYIFAKVILCTFLDSTGMLPEVDLIQVSCHDVFLAQFVIQTHAQINFLNFAFDFFLGAEIFSFLLHLVFHRLHDEIVDRLHGQRRASL